MTIHEQLDRKARKLASKRNQSAQELIQLYRKLAEQEELELKVDEETLPEVEFRIGLTSGIILQLIEARKRMEPKLTEPSPLIQVVATLVEDFLDGASSS
jgi:hypothetical protein